MFVFTYFVDVMIIENKRLNKNIKQVIRSFLSAYEKLLFYLEIKQKSRKCLKAKTANQLKTKRIEKVSNDKTPTKLFGSFCNLTMLSELIIKRPCIKLHTNLQQA